MKTTGFHMQQEIAFELMVDEQQPQETAVRVSVFMSKA
jgi:hypothetical protein